MPARISEAERERRREIAEMLRGVLDTGMSKAGMARRLGLTPGHFQKILNGKGGISLGLIRKQLGITATVASVSSIAARAHLKDLFLEVIESTLTPDQIATATVFYRQAVEAIKTLDELLAGA